MNLGDYIHKLRIKRQLTLREFCARFDISNIWWSRVERNLELPQQDLLLSIGTELNLTKYEKQKLTKLYLNYQKPEPLTEEEFAPTLPFVFKPMTEEQLLNLADLLRETE